MDADLERRAERIFDEAIDLPTGSRAAAAHRACGGDATLLAAVNSLLSAANVRDGFLGSPTVDADATVGTDARAATVAERPGTVVGPYKLLQVIGEGGFGVVYMAEQTRPVKRRVALKVIKLGMDTRDVVARFEAERQALALMDHPNIAKVHDAGSTDAGRPYFVMELVNGVPITAYADANKLTARQRLELMVPVCRAVQHAHTKGVIHRDLKPSNVLVTLHDGKPVPKVIDFGIAKATGPTLTDRTLFTRFGSFVGTPAYMSPEQAERSGLDVDTRTDVYGLGVLLYELLTGTTPIDPRSLRTAAYEQMFKLIRESDPPKPSTRLTTDHGTQSAVASARGTDPKRLGQAVRGEVDWIVMKALEKDRNRRYESASALADDLGRYLSGDAVHAGPVSGTYRLRKTLRRYKLAVGVGGAIAACLLLGVAGTTYGLVEARHERSAAVASATAATANQHRAEAGEADARREKAAATASAADATAKAAEAKATLDFFTGLLAKASPKQSRDATVSQVLVDKLIAPALATVDQQFAGQPLVRAAVQDTLVVTLCDLGRPDLASPQARAAYDARRHLFGPNHPDTLMALNNYATTVDRLGRHAEAEQLWKQCCDAQRQVQGAAHPTTLLFLNNYAVAILTQGRPVEAGRLFKQIWDTHRQVQGDDHPDTLMAMGHYADALGQQGQYATAEPLLKQGWDTRRRVQGENHPSTLLALNNYAGVINAQGRHAEAEPLWKQCWEAERQVQGANHPNTLAALHNYAAAIDAQGRHAEAEPLWWQAADGFRRACPDDQYRGAVLFQLGRCLATQQKWAAAETVARENWAWDRAHPSPTRGAVPGSLRLLNECLRHEGKPLEGDAATRPATAPATIASAFDAGALSQRAWESATTGHSVAAVPLLRHAADYYRQSAPDDAGRGPALYRLGLALEYTRQWPEAEAVARENWSFDQTHPSLDRKPGTTPGSLMLLNRCLKAQGKSTEPTTAPGDPASRMSD